ASASSSAGSDSYDTFATVMSPVASAASASATRPGPPSGATTRQPSAGPGRTLEGVQLDRLKRFSQREIDLHTPPCFEHPIRSAGPDPRRGRIHQTETASINLMEAR